eukprot:CAMPEP_0171639826 /NCGR_PEP_ID=MMETSP0990-20121206/29991_1 /TAXON_ID=483369 /ORGANISM="non described non described, Strain CCMP2098" /LENGTH=152 /DNA_ID=CAMNT_0012213731 /DNA_START=149 /DNA_END=607 /DNA_ORIENTATION=+
MSLLPPSHQRLQAQGTRASTKHTAANTGTAFRYGATPALAARVQVMEALGGEEREERVRGLQQPLLGVEFAHPPPPLLAPVEGKGQAGGRKDAAEDPDEHQPFHSEELCVGQLGRNNLVLREGASTREALTIVSDSRPAPSPPPAPPASKCS